MSRLEVGRFGQANTFGVTSFFHLALGRVKRPGLRPLSVYKCLTGSVQPDSFVMERLGWKEFCNTAQRKLNPQQSPG